MSEAAIWFADAVINTITDPSKKYVSVKNPCFMLQLLTESKQSSILSSMVYQNLHLQEENNFSK